MVKKKRTEEKHNYFAWGWGCLFLGMSMHTILTVLNTFLQDFQLISKDQVVQQFKIEISGWSLGIPSLIIVCGLIMIMLDPIGLLISKSRWRK